MNILLLTSHVRDIDFQSLVGKATVKPNPAGQNFYGKLLDSLRAIFNVHVVSLIPNRESILRESVCQENNVQYRYVTNYSFLPTRLLLQVKHVVEQSEEELREFIPDFIVYDSLSVALSKASRILSDRYGYPRIAVLTDDPHNITGATTRYIHSVLSNSKQADGYFALTEGLLNAFSVKTKKNILIRPGIVEPYDELPRPYEKPYIYYGGALFVKDGTKALIDVYNKFQPDYDLVISGHGAYEGKVKEAAENNPRIHYLGQISKKDNYSYQQHADLLINPRLYSKKLDAVSVPSKVLEYLVNGKHIVSTVSTDLKKRYPTSITWTEGDVTSLDLFFQEHLNENKQFINLAENKTKGTIEGQLGVKALSTDLFAFFSSIKDNQQ